MTSLRRLVWLLPFATACSAPSAVLPVEGERLVTGLHLSEVALYQGLKTTLMKEGEAVAPKLPLIAGRAGLWRVFVTPEDGWDGREVKVRLELSDGATASPALEVTRRFTAASSDGELESTANFEVPGERHSPGLRWSVSLYEVTPGAPRSAPGVRFPAAGEAPLGARATAVEQIVLLPIRYLADGSGRLPDVGPAQLERMRRRLLALYPLADARFVVGEPLDWSRAVDPQGNGWGELLDAVAARRANAGVARDVYYYGMFQPAASLSAFCQGGCVQGVTPGTHDPDDDYGRASVGLGYSDADAGTEEVFVHELGHAHGRDHAPCEVDPADTDWDYPYTDGELGVWGYDADHRQLYAPAGPMRDVMGYCNPTWVSDYTYRGLDERITYLAAHPTPLTPRARFQTAIVSGGQGTLGSRVTLTAPGGEARTAERLGAGGWQRFPVRFYPFSHIPGGLVLLPEAEAVGALRFEGRRLR